MWGAIDALRVFGISHVPLQGRLDIDLAPDWSPHGVQRVMDMASSGFFQDIAFFRAVPGFLVQVCVHARAYLPVWLCVKRSCLLVFVSRSRSHT